MRDLIMNNLPYNLHSEIDDLLTTMILDKIKNSWEYGLNKLIIKISLFLVYAHLKVCLNSYYKMQNCN